MVKFLIMKDGFYPDDIEFLKDNFSVSYTSNEDTSIFETDDKFTGRLIVFEEAGIIKVIREARDLGIVDSLSLLDDVIDKIEKKAGDPVFFYIYIDGERIKFTPSEFMAVRKWREKLIEIDIQMASRIRSRAFDEFINELRTRIDVVWKDEETEEDMLGSIIMEGVKQLMWVANEKDFLRNPVSRLRLPSDDIDVGGKVAEGEGDSQNQSVFIVKSSTMKELLDQRGLNISLVKAREVIRPYLYRNSKQRRIGGERVSVWFFKE